MRDNFYTYHTDAFKTIQTLLSKMKTITMPQFEALLAGYKNYSPLSVLHSLQTSGIVEVQGDLITRYHSPSYERENIESLWVALDLLSKDNGLIDKKDVDSISVGTDIINLSIILDRTLIVNIVHVDKGEKAVVVGAVQRFYNITGCEKGKEKDEHILHLFETADPEAFKMLQDMDIQIPYKLAFVEGDCIKKPEITYV